MRASSSNVFNSKPQTERVDQIVFTTALEPKQMKWFRRKIQKAKKVINDVLESNFLITFMSTITIYVLFADDVRQLITDIRVDDVVYTITSVCLGIFTVEILLSSFAKPRYFLSFFFWLDILSTASLILDIGWVSSEIFDTNSGSGGPAGTAQPQKEGRASQIGERATRIIKIIRLIRLVRIVKLYKAAQSTFQRHQSAQIVITNVITEHEESLVQHNPPSSSILQNKVTLSKEILSQVNDDLPSNNMLRPPVSHLEQINALERRRRASNLLVFEDLKLRRFSHFSPEGGSALGGLGPGLSGFGGGGFRKSQFGGTGSHEENALISRKDSTFPGGENNGNNDAREPYRALPPLRPSIFNHMTDDVNKITDTAQSRRRKSGSKGKRGSKYRGSIDHISRDSYDESKSTRKKEMEIPQETNVGKKLSALTTKRVITVVMSVLITIPIFSADTYLTDYSSAESGLRTIWLMNQTGSRAAFELAVNKYILDFENLRRDLYVLDIKGDRYFTGGEESSLRDSEKQVFTVEGVNSTVVKGFSVVSYRSDMQLNAILSICRTIFVTIVLAVAALSFAKDTNKLVLAPIESMLIKVKRIAANPLAAAQIEEEDALLQEELEKQGKHKTLLRRKRETTYETNILEKTILKLGALLALGFGEAGSNIIAQNMSKSGEVDPMIPGKKVMAIFGFCDIRNFTDATEVLQEGVMVFVNEIAEIVHGTINEFSGAANKNIGDAFLLVWKFGPDEVEVNPDDNSVKLKPGIKVSQLADMSVISFLKVFAGIHKSKRLEKYKHNEGLVQRLPNYSVKMGFGLHVGWAIEGAIGSEYKIDASYLSPNVNMASRLEAATKQFGVPFLFSGQLYDICTSETKKQLRRVDRVTVKGSNQPLDLYTCDADPSRLSIDKTQVDFSTLTPSEKKKIRVQSRNRRDELRDKAFSEQTRVAKAFASDKDIVLMRQKFNRDFYHTFKEGMNAYTNGDWRRAKVAFENTLHMIPDYKDGPSSTLLRFMKETDFKAPPDWKGYRELTEK